MIVLARNIDDAILFAAVPINRSFRFMVRYVTVTKLVTWFSTGAMDSALLKLIAPFHFCIALQRTICLVTEHLEHVTSIAP